MAEHDVPLVYDASLDVTSNALTTWHGDGDPATYLTLEGGGTDSLWSVIPFTDLTAVAGQVTDFRLEIDVSAGSSVVDYLWRIQHPANPGTVIYEAPLLNLPGPGTHTFSGASMTLLGLSDGSDLWTFITKSMAQDPADLWSVMRLIHDVDQPDVTLTGFRLVILTTEDVVRPATRMFPRDDALGLSSAPRLVPPPKARRVVGGYL